MSSVIKLARGSMGDMPCGICGEKHVPQNKCRHEALTQKLSLYNEANKMIGPLMAANTEAIAAGKQMEVMAKQLEAALSIMQDVVKEKCEPKLTDEIKDEFLARMDIWLKESLNLATEQREQATKSSILNETGDRLSTEEAMSGGPSPLIL